MWVCVPGAQYSFWRSKKFLFLVALSRGYIFEESSRSVQDVIGDVYCLGKYCLNRENCESIGGYVTTPRSIYGCGKCGAWLLVHKSLFVIQEHARTTKTDKFRFFFARKRWTWYPTNKYYLMPHFNQPNKERKNCAWTTKYERLSETCIVQHVEMKSVYISTKKTTSFYDCKKCKACCNVLNIPFRDQKPTILLFGGDGTHCFARKTSRDYEKEKLSPFLKKFLRQSQSSTSEPEPNKVKMSSNME